MLNRRRKKFFVLVVPRFEDFFHSFYAGEIIKGVSLAASRLRMDILIHITDRFDHRSWLDSSLLDKDIVEGIIFGDIDNDLNIVKKAITRGVPSLVLNNILEEPVNFVAIDNERATRDAIAHLVKLGHTKIATVAGDLSTQAGVARLKGYREALKEAGITVPRYYVKQGDFLRTPAREAAAKLLKLKDRPTAVFVASDVMAFEVIDVARANGLRVPADLSVIGFDDNPLNVNCSVPLTTVAQPLVEMGRLGAEHLKQICQGQARLPVKVVLPARLVERKSTRELSSAA